MGEVRNGKIYGIKNDIDNRMYIGSTIMKLSDRWTAHKSAKLKKATKLYKAFNEIGLEHFEIFLIEDVPCQSRAELLSRERYHIKQYDAIENGLNMYLSGRTKEERKEYKRQTDKAYRDAKGQELLDKKKVYYQNNKERCKENVKRSQERNKEARKQYMKEYAEKNKEKLSQYHKEYYLATKAKNNTSV